MRRDDELTTHLQHKACVHHVLAAWNVLSVSDGVAPCPELCQRHKVGQRQARITARFCDGGQDARSRYDIWGNNIKQKKLSCVAVVRC